MAITERRRYIAGLSVSERDVAEITRDLVELALRFVPQERRERFARELDFYFASGRLSGHTVA